MPSGGNRSTRRGAFAMAHGSQSKSRPRAVLRDAVTGAFQQASQVRTSVSDKTIIRAPRGAAEP